MNGSESVTTNSIVLSPRRVVMQRVMLAPIVSRVRRTKTIRYTITPAFTVSWFTMFDAVSADVAPTIQRIRATTAGS